LYFYIILLKYLLSRLVAKKMRRMLKVGKLAIICVKVRQFIPVSAIKGDLDYVRESSEGGGGR